MVSLLEGFWLFAAVANVSRVAGFVVCMEQYQAVVSLIHAIPVCIRVGVVVTRYFENSGIPGI